MGRVTCAVLKGGNGASGSATAVADADKQGPAEQGGSAETGGPHSNNLEPK